MSTTNSYKAREFNLSGLSGISDETLEMHFKLYEGYVKETNKLTEAIDKFIQDGQVDQEEMPAYSELTRRLGFEYNGMVLHEYYFDNLKSGGGTGDPDRTAQFAKAAASSFGSYEIWKADFVGIGKGRHFIHRPRSAKCQGALIDDGPAGCKAHSDNGRCPPQGVPIQP